MLPPDWFKPRPEAVQAEIEFQRRERRAELRQSLRTAPLLRFDVDKGAKRRSVHIIADYKDDLVERLVDLLLDHHDHFEHVRQFRGFLDTVEHASLDEPVFDAYAVAAGDGLPANAFGTAPFVAATPPGMRPTPTPDSLVAQLHHALRTARALYDDTGCDPSDGRFDEHRKHLRDWLRAVLADLMGDPQREQNRWATGFWRDAVLLLSECRPTMPQSVRDQAAVVIGEIFGLEPAPRVTESVRKVRARERRRKLRKESGERESPGAAQT